MKGNLSTFLNLLTFTILAKTTIASTQIPTLASTANPTYNESSVETDWALMSDSCYQAEDVWYNSESDYTYSLRTCNASELPIPYQRKSECDYRSVDFDDPDMALSKLKDVNSAACNYMSSVTADFTIDATTEDLYKTCAEWCINQTLSDNDFVCRSVFISYNSNTALSTCVGMECGSPIVYDVRYNPITFDTDNVYTRYRTLWFEDMDTCAQVIMQDTTSLGTWSPTVAPTTTQSPDINDTCVNYGDYYESYYDGRYIPVRQCEGATMPLAENVTSNACDFKILDYDDLRFFGSGRRTYEKYHNKFVCSGSTTYKSSKFKYASTNGYAQCANYCLSLTMSNDGYQCNSVWMDWDGSNGWNCVTYDCVGPTATSDSYETVTFDQPSGGNYHRSIWLDNVTQCITAIKIANNPTQLPTVSPTPLPTVFPTEAPTLEPTDSPTLQPTEAPTLEPTDSPTLQPTEAPTTLPSLVSTMVSEALYLTKDYHLSFNFELDATYSSGAQAVLQRGASRTLTAYIRQPAIFIAQGSSTLLLRTSTSSNLNNGCSSNIDLILGEMYNIEVLVSSTNYTNLIINGSLACSIIYSSTEKLLYVDESEPVYIGTPESSFVGAYATVSDITWQNLTVQTDTPTTAPTQDPTYSPTLGPTNAPTAAPTLEPTSAPTLQPTTAPTFEPTSTPTLMPTDAPTLEPTDAPSLEPTSTPKLQPTSAPTLMPTSAPTLMPTSAPTLMPTSAPTLMPTDAPTLEPTDAPTLEPTSAPTQDPTNSPTLEPTDTPTLEPTDAPTLEQTSAPTLEPTSAPTLMPTSAPTLIPTDAPTLEPTSAPTQDPTNSPTLEPTSTPTLIPTDAPTLEPTSAPTQDPIISPTLEPTDAPTLEPTSDSTLKPSAAPTQDPTNSPTLESTLDRTSAPTLKPTQNPTYSPTLNPTNMPTVLPTASSIQNTSSIPTRTPISPTKTISPTLFPTTNPTEPSSSESPTYTPSEFPSISPTQGTITVIFNDTGALIGTVLGASGLLIVSIVFVVKFCILKDK